MLFAVPDDRDGVASEDEFEEIIVGPGQSVTFPCYSATVGVDFRCSEDRTNLIYSSGKIHAIFASKFSVHIEGGWYKFTVKETSSDAMYCYCFEDNGGPLLKKFKTVVTGLEFFVSI